MRTHIPNFSKIAILAFSISLLVFNVDAGTGGKMCGKYIVYYENGQISIFGYHWKGIKTGHWISYFEDGGIKSEGDYENGKKRGRWLLRNDKGQEQGMYVNGLREEHWMVRSHKGHLITEGKYKHGEKNGVWKLYKNGHVIKRETYRKGVLIEQ